MGKREPVGTKTCCKPLLEKVLYNLKQLFDQTIAQLYTESKQKLRFFYSLPSDLALQNNLLLLISEQ